LYFLLFYAIEELPCLVYANSSGIKGKLLSNPVFFLIYKGIIRESINPHRNNEGFFLFKKFAAKDRYRETEK
jgi:hypothetical protein